MLEFTQKDQRPSPGARKVILPWEKRIKSRLRVELDDGTEAGIFLPRGTILRCGDCLATTAGEQVVVEAAAEKVSTVNVSEPQLLARICYHLGNRHVSLAIRPDGASYLHDHVLDDMVRQLGGKVSVEEIPFEPEHGAYSTHSAAHEHSHG